VEPDFFDSKKSRTGLLNSELLKDLKTGKRQIEENMKGTGAN
jgi:hypothetical protein